MSVYRQNPQADAPFNPLRIRANQTHLRTTFAPGMLAVIAVCIAYSAYELARHGFALAPVKTTIASGCARP